MAVTSYLDNQKPYDVQRTLDGKLIVGGQAMRGQQVLPSMRYKNFIWPNNPATCKYSVDRAYAKHKYPELRGVELEDMDPNAIVLSGEGEFFGFNAGLQWSNLLKVFNDYGIGDFFHPIYTDISKALLIKLESTIEPRADYVKYTFEFVVSDTIPWIQTIVEVEPKNSTDTVVDTSTGTSIKVGDTVVCNGYAYYNPQGGNPHTALMTNKTMTVTYTDFRGSHPIHVGSHGWMRLSDVRLGSTSASPPSGGGYQTYTVKAGDTLSGIGKRFGVNWRDIATLNSIKDPNKIYVGQVFKIPS